MTITITIPVKALVLYAYYMSINPTWENRKVPDYLVSVIGNHTNPNDLVTMTVDAGQLLNFIFKLSDDNYTKVGDAARSIFSNSPSIPGYTALFNQIIAKANGTSSEKDAAAYMVAQYNQYTQMMSNAYNDMYQNGLNFIHN